MMDSASTRTWTWAPANDGEIPVQVCTDITNWHTANGPQEKAYDDMVRLDCGYTIAEEHIYNGKRSFGYRAFNTVEDVYKEITSRPPDIWEGMENREQEYHEVGTVTVIR